ncbi:MAG: tRNA lysidine(34) synthetase TilS [Clostridia bacterium]|nr:tRNA lysidine(34) synthetase TilS [Clostridia bacterium]
MSIKICKKLRLAVLHALHEVPEAVRPGSVLVGFSGGADSTALVLLLEDIFPGRVFCVHVNHHLRPGDCDGDEAFVRELCHRRRIPLLTFGLKLEGSDENLAREARMRCFRDAMEKTGADCLCLAHHMDDQAETILEHLFRGSGMQGLCGMRVWDDGGEYPVFRPLLGVRHEDLIEYLRERGQVWREDATNHETVYTRNRLRHLVLPEVEKIFPGAAERLCQTGRIIQGDEEVLASSARETADPFFSKNYFPLSALEALPLGLKRRVLRMWVCERCMTGEEKQRGLPFADTERLVELLGENTGKSVNLPRGRKATKGYLCLHVDGRAEDTEPVRIHTSSLPPDGMFGDGKRSQAMPGMLLDECQVRSRRQGDWIRPFGSSGRQSLQDYFVNRRVDAPFREKVPLLCRGSEVLMAAGVGTGNVPRYVPGETDTAADWILLTWEGPLPWLDLKDPDQ